MSNEQKSSLVALVFDDPYKAEEARAAIHRMGGEGLLEIDEIAIIAKDKDGKVRSSQDVNHTAKDQHIGHIIGLVTGAITATLPFIMAGTLAGRLMGKLTDHGITNKFRTELTKAVQPGTSALIILGRSDAERRRKIAERLQNFSPKLLESDFPPELERELSQELEGVRKGAAGSLTPTGT